MLLRMENGQIMSIEQVAAAHQKAQAQGEGEAPPNIFASKEAFTDYIVAHTDAGGYSAPAFLHLLSQGDLHLLCPPGIGDVAWVWAKWQHVQRERQERGLNTTFWFPPDEPFRVGTYADMVGMNMGDIGRGRGKLPGLHTHWMLQTPGDPGEVPEEGVVVIHANKHLEAGKPLAEWCPYLPLGRMLPEEIKATTDGEAPIVVHMAHYGYMEGNLIAGMWARMIKHLCAIHEPGVMLTGGNSGDDLKFARQVLDLKASEWGKPWGKRGVYTMFDQPLPTVLRWICNSPAVIGVASGLEILSVAAGAPTLMAYPRWLQHMPGTWEPEGAPNTWVYMDELYDWVMAAKCAADLPNAEDRFDNRFRAGVL